MSYARNVRVVASAAAIYAVAALVASCQSKSGSEPPAMSPVITDSLAAARTSAALDQAKQAYLGYCAMCHGEWGNGDGPMAAELKKESGTGPAVLNLRGRLQKIGRKEVIEVIRKGGAHTHRSNLMPPWGERLDDQLIANMADFIMTLPDLKPGPTTDVIRQFLQAPPGSSGEGRRLFVFYCTACHGPQGKGNGPSADTVWARNKIRPRDLTDSSYFAAKTDQELFSTLSLGGAHMGKSVYMPAWTASLTAPQIKDLLSYVRTISRTRPVN